MRFKTIAATCSVLLVAVLATCLTAQDSRPKGATSKPAAKPAKKEAAHPGLLKPSLAAEKAPAKFKVKFETTKGDFVIEVTRAWSPNGADRFYNLVKIGYYQNIAFFRVIAGFMAQFGIHGDTEITRQWRAARIKDDPSVKSNTRGMITYAMAGQNTRTTQLFINYKNNSGLDKQGFTPFGKVLGKGMSVVDKLYAGYGNASINQGTLTALGDKYLKKNFPQVDYLKKASLVK